MPKAYVIAQIDVTDPETYEHYKSGTPGSIAEFGGQFLVRGGTVTALEGEQELPRVVVIEFPDRATAERWYHSEQYTALRAVRQDAAVGKVMLVDGAD